MTGFTRDPSPNVPIEVEVLAEERNRLRVRVAELIAENDTLQKERLRLFGILTDLQTVLEMRETLIGGLQKQVAELEESLDGWVHDHGHRRRE
jgi:hypothetical protein